MPAGPDLERDMLLERRRRPKAKPGYGHDYAGRERAAYPYLMEEVAAGYFFLPSTLRSHSRRETEQVCRLANSLKGRQRKKRGWGLRFLGDLFPPAKRFLVDSVEYWLVLRDLVGQPRGCLLATNKLVDLFNAATSHVWSKLWPLGEETNWLEASPQL